MNSILCGNVQGQFVTAGYVYLDVEKNQLAYAGAGHPPLLVWQSREKKAVAIEENGLFLGAFPGCAYTAVTSNFEPGDRCVLYTDGILEAPNPRGRGVRERAPSGLSGIERPFARPGILRCPCWPESSSGADAVKMKISTTT